MLDYSALKLTRILASIVRKPFATSARENSKICLAVCLGYNASQNQLNISTYNSVPRSCFDQEH